MITGEKIGGNLLEIRLARFGRMTIASSCAQFPLTFSRCKKFGTLFQVLAGITDSVS